MQITRLSAPNPRGERLDLHLDGEFRLALPRAIADRHGLAVGGEVDATLLARLTEESLAWRTRESALTLLAHRPRSERELRARLLRRGLPETAVDECIGELRDRKVLDDAEYARSFARERVRNRATGRRRVLGEMRARGIDPSEAERALDTAFAEEAVDELALARQASRRFRERTGEERTAARRRFHAFLHRRGFPAEVIRQLLHERFSSSTGSAGQESEPDQE